jgi:hypothetical protein
MAAFGFPISDDIAIRERTTKSLAAWKMFEPVMKGLSLYFPPYPSHVLTQEGGLLRRPTQR